MRDLRRYARQTQVRLIAGGLIILLVAGGGLIYLIYGPGPALSGLLCLAGGLSPIIVIFLILQVIDWIVRRANHD